MFRAWHRGIREMDLILGSFADACIDELDSEELGDFEKLIEVDDWEIYRWITGEAPIPPEFDSALLRRISAYRPDEPAC